MFKILKWLFILPYRAFLLSWAWFALYHLCFTVGYKEGYEQLVVVCIIWIALTPSLFYTNTFDGKTYWKGL